jgi:hypothetical protein
MLGVNFRVASAVAAGSISIAALAFTSSSALANSITFNNVTFSLAEVGANELQLAITNALNANGNWAGIKFLEAFDLNPSGGTWTSASVINVSGWNSELGGLSNGKSGVGCNGSGAGDICFYSSPVNPPSPPNYPADPYPLSNNMVFDIQFAGGATDFSITHLKIDFWTSPQANCTQKGSAWNCNSAGDLLSQDITVAVPGPIVGAGLPGLTAACGGLIALARRRRKLG